MESEYRETLEFLGQSTLLKPTTAVIAEHEKQFDPMEEAWSVKRYRKLKQGDAALSFYRQKLNKRAATSNLTCAETDLTS